MLLDLANSFSTGTVSLLSWKCNNWKNQTRLITSTKDIHTSEKFTPLIGPNRIWNQNIKKTLVGAWLYTPLNWVTCLFRNFDEIKAKAISSKTGQVMIASEYPPGYVMSMQKHAAHYIFKIVIIHTIHTLVSPFLGESPRWTRHSFLDT